MNIEAWVQACCVVGEGRFERLGRLYGSGSYADKCSFSKWAERTPDLADVLHLPRGHRFPIMADLREALLDAGFLRSGNFGPFVGIALRSPSADA